jgi:hypothetical protein
MFRPIPAPGRLGIGIQHIPGGRGILQQRGMGQRLLGQLIVHDEPARDGVQDPCAVNGSQRA